MQLYASMRSVGTSERHSLEYICEGQSSTVTSLPLPIVLLDAGNAACAVSCAATAGSLDAAVEAMIGDHATGECL
jgi:hypothetical protein